MSESGLNELNMSISGLEDRQKDLLRKRRNVLDQLNDNKFNRDRNNFGHQRPYDGVKDRYQDDQFNKKVRLDESNHNQVRVKRESPQRNHLIKSKISSTIVMNNQEVKGGEEKDETKETKPIEVNKNDTARNRNVFGSLMNHLKRAKNLLESEQPRIKQQVEATHKAQEKNEQEAQKLKLQMAEKNKEKRKIQELERQQTEKDLIKINHDLQLAKIKKYYSQLSNFIQTKQQPCLFWFPNKMNQILTELKQETEKNLKQKCEESEQKVVVECERQLNEFETKLKQKEEYKAQKALERQQTTGEEEQNEDKQSDLDNNETNIDDIIDNNQ